MNSTRSRLRTRPTSFSYPGSTPIISANGDADRIVWDLDRATRELRAYNALNLADELYTSAQAANGRDRLGPPAKFSVPIVANGMVYAATLNGTLVGYGLLNHGTKTDEGPGITSNAVSTQSLQAIGLGAPISLTGGNATRPAVDRFIRRPEWSWPGGPRTSQRPECRYPAVRQCR